MEKRGGLGAGDGLVVKMESCQAIVGKKEVDLTVTECGLLACLLEQPGATFTRAELIRRVWGDSFAGKPETVNTHILRLRKKLGKVAVAIQSVRGQGYRWKPPLVRKTRA